MSFDYLTQLDYCLRFLLAGICGALIGYERKSRLKEAGIRTHFIVALGAALMMVVSKYGFQDEAYLYNTTLDPSRIAAQIVSGVGFLGAGMIFMQKHTVKGLTTAAGIWATAGMGMAIGAGLYFIGFMVTLLILIAQIIFHKKFNWLATPKTEQLSLQIINEPGSMENIRKLLAERNISIISFHAEKDDHYLSYINLEIIIKLSNSYNTEQLLTLIQDIPSIKSVEI